MLLLARVLVLLSPGCGCKREHFGDGFAIDMTNRKIKWSR